MMHEINGEKILSTLREEGTRLPIPVFRQILSDERVVAVVWKQYTPGWNDGEPCEFTMDGRELVLRSGWHVCDSCHTVYPEGVEIPEICPGWSYFYRTPRRCTMSDTETAGIVGIDDDLPVLSRPSRLSEEIAVADNTLSALEEILRFVFGEPVQVIARLVDDEVVFTTTEYDCGY